MMKNKRIKAHNIFTFVSSNDWSADNTVFLFWTLWRKVYWWSSHLSFQRYV